MKKNLMSVIILALLVVNLVLTSVLMFTIYPQAKAANELITAVCNAIDLDLHSGAASGLGSIPLDKVELYSVNDGADMTFNLKKGDSNKTEYAVIGVALSINKTSSTYEKDGVTQLSEKEPLIKDTIDSVIRTYTKDEFDTNTDAVKKEILKKLQNIFGADYVIGISFTKGVTN
ncbi:MAG: flagellar basal body-associated FliL family protein [Agathobacter sp.]